MTEPTLLVLAAGMGSRYGGLKQMDPIGSNGETIIDYSIFDARRAGFQKVVFVIRREIERQFKEVIGARFERKFPVAYVFQELDQLPADFSVPANRSKPWGTGHAILMAGEIIEGPFVAINADDFYGANSFRALADHFRGDNPDFAMVGFVLRNTLSNFGKVARGVCRTTDDGFLENITEMTGIERDGTRARVCSDDGTVLRLTGDETVSMNMWGFTVSLFGELRKQFTAFLQEHGHEEKSEFYIPTAINRIVQAKVARVKVLRTPDSWFGVTYREDRPFVVGKIRELIQSGQYPEKLSY